MKEIQRNRTSEAQCGPGHIPRKPLMSTSRGHERTTPDTAMPANVAEKGDMDALLGPTRRPSLPFRHKKKVGLEKMRFLFLRLANQSSATLQKASPRWNRYRGFDTLGVHEPLVDRVHRVVHRHITLPATKNSNSFTVICDCGCTT